MRILVSERHAATRHRINTALRDMAGMLNVTIHTQNTAEATLWRITGLDDGTEHIFSLFRTGELFETIRTPDGKTWCGPMTVEELGG